MKNIFKNIYPFTGPCLGSISNLIWIIFYIAIVIFISFYFTGYFAENDFANNEREVEKVDFDKLRNDFVVVCIEDRMIEHRERLSKPFYEKTKHLLYEEVIQECQVEWVKFMEFLDFE